MQPNEAWWWLAIDRQVGRQWLGDPGRLEAQMITS